MLYTIHITDDLYPNLLKQIHDPPETLYAQGDLSLLSKPGLAIVGMRRCSKRGENLAFDWARRLSRQGLTIVSGLAFGIDAAAHRGAMEGSGKTIAVVPACLPEVMPRSHRKLADEILAKGGLLLSEWDLPRPTRRHDYLVRNRVVSGLSRGVLVVEAAHKSGAINTAIHALSQNREIMAVPGHPNEIESQGCLRLLKEGAAMVRSTVEVLEALGLEYKKEQQLELPIELKTLYQSIRAAPKTVAELPEGSISKLTQLELQGLLKRDRFGRYAVA
ncbi:MAG: DNA processing protein [Oceanicoccus sp.]|jgi:DNA processing protein